MCGKLEKTWCVLVIGALLGVSACAEDEAGDLSYGASARQNYELGMTELEDENYLEAAKYFQYVKNKFPFSKYAAYGELRFADTQFAEGKHLEAVDTYKLFVRAHPTHSEVLSGYAEYRIVRAYVEQMPGDWFVTPPAYERDQAAARDALREARNFLERYAESKYKSRVRRYLTRIVRRLVDHELYAADFYLARDKPQAAAWRLQALLEEYPESGEEGDVLLLLGKTYLKMKDAKRARDTFARMAEQTRDEQQARKGKLYLDFMARQGL